MGACDLVVPRYLGAVSFLVGACDLAVPTAAEKMTCMTYMYVCKKHIRSKHTKNNIHLYCTTVGSSLCKNT